MATSRLAPSDPSVVWVGTASRTTGKAPPGAMVRTRSLDGGDLEKRGWRRRATSGES